SRCNSRISKGGEGIGEDIVGTTGAAGGEGGAAGGAVGAGIIGEGSRRGDCIESRTCNARVLHAPRNSPLFGLLKWLSAVWTYTGEIPRRRKEDHSSRKAGSHLSKCD